MEKMEVGVYTMTEEVDKNKQVRDGGLVIKLSSPIYSELKKENNMECFC